MLALIAAVVIVPALLVLLSPLLVLLAAAVILLPLAHLLPRAHPALAHLSFACPFHAKRRASVDFLTVPGVEQPLDVASCSIFDGGPVRCAKRCLGLVEARATPPPIVARYALLADGEAFLDAADHEPVARPTA
jgi:hypothetical protein